MTDSHKPKHLFSTLSQPALLIKRRTTLVVALSALFLVAAWGCGDDEPVDTTDDVGASDMSDAGQDAMNDADMDAPWTPLDRFPVQDGVSEDGLDPTMPAPAGESRVGRIVGDTSFTGTWAHCRAGDFKLYNALVKFCVQAETTNIQEMFTGGMVVDADVIGSTADDNFTLFNPRIGLNAEFAESVKIVRDGSDGGPAIIRVEGHDYPMAYLVGVVGPSLFKANDITLTTEYRLFPDSAELEIVTWASNPGTLNKTLVIGDWFGVSDRSQTFRQMYGFEATLKEFDYVLGRSDQGAAFSYRAEEPVKIDELPFSAASPWLLFNYGQRAIESGQEIAYRRWMGVGVGMESLRGPVLDALERDAAREPSTVTVIDTASEPVVGRMVAISQGDEKIIAERTDAAGEVNLKLMPGEYTVEVEAAVGGVVTSKSLTLGGADGSVEVPALGTIDMVVSDADGQTTAVVKVLGEQRAEFFAYRGIGSIDLEPGTYTLVVSAGMEYEVLEKDVVITAGETVNWAPMLDHIVDTTGWIAGDFHQHMESSTDSSVYIQDRIWDNIAEGIEFVASTDHDVVTDLQSYIDELGVADLLGTFPGVEISPRVSHTGVYPVIPDHNKRGNNTIAMADWDDNGLVYREIPDIFAAARAMPNNPVIQLNHARGGASLFDNTGYEPTDDPRTFEHKIWSTDFDVMEIVNRVDRTCQLFADWSTFQNVGLRRTALGNSDTHKLKGSSAGSVRNYMPIDKAPQDILDSDVVSAMKSGQVVVAQNAYLSFTDGRLPSDVITAVANQDTTFDVRVQTASWTNVTKIFMVVNGSVVQEIDATGTNGFDFDDTITHQFSDDSWVVFFAWGPSPTTKADFRGPTFTFNNPIFVDVGGDGWTEPGVLPLDLDALNVDGWCD